VNGGDILIDFTPLENVLRKRRRTFTSLVQDKIIGGGTLSRLKHNEPVSTDTIDALCNALHCKPMDIMRYTPGDAPAAPIDQTTDE
jgi:DNA-binding Xre family transcriptional regulator